MPGGFVETVKLAFTNQYLSRSSAVEGPRSFYVMTRDMERFETFVSSRDEISAFDKTFLDNIAIVETSDNVTAVFNTIRRLPFVDTITSIPLFCH